MRPSKARSANTIIRRLWVGSSVCVCRSAAAIWYTMCSWPWKDGFLDGSVAGLIWLNQTIDPPSWWEKSKRRAQRPASVEHASLPAKDDRKDGDKQPPDGNYRDKFSDRLHDQSPRIAMKRTKMMIAQAALTNISPISGIPWVWRSAVAMWYTMCSWPWGTDSLMGL